MGICMDTGRNQLYNGQDTNSAPTTFGSWPKQLNGSLRYHRMAPQARAMSEPIMVVNGNRIEESNPANLADSSSSGPGPPKIVPLALQRKVVPVQGADLPDVPIVFVLGGPGSGKITHCERLAIMDERLVHLNMMLAFLEIATEMGSQDPNIVPAYKALEILIERISAIEKDVSGALIISGYPRNMRDVVEYMARVQRVDGVILLDWSDRSLERQIQLGARMGDIDINLARYEMNNYRSNIIPVAQYFDQQGHLHIVAGQRAPAEVFDDFAEEINGILSSTLNEPTAATATVPDQSAPNDSEPTNDIEIDGPLPKETEVVIHTSSSVDNNNEKQHIKREPSIDSVDLMIEEEIKHITDDLPPDSHVPAQNTHVEVPAVVNDVKSQ